MMSSLCIKFRSDFYFQQSSLKYIQVASLVLRDAFLRLESIMSNDRYKLMKKGAATIWLCNPGSSLFFISGLSIDADGAPNAYHPRGKPGLDFLGNAGGPGNWYGIVTRDGKKSGNPIIQGAGDPCPGYYVSPTSLADSTQPRSSPRRYVDSAQIPYIALPGDLLKHKYAYLGDIAVVWNAANGILCPAIVADAGPRGHIGEGSIALARTLLLRSDARHGGIGRGICYVVFSGSRQRPAWPLTKPRIETLANEYLLSWGGVFRIREYYSKDRGTAWKYLNHSVGDLA